MFYQDSNDYMRDSYFYGNNPYVPNYPFYMGQNPYNKVNLNNMYPQIYRIINPVATRVISSSNYQYINEDNLNNLVDTVFNIVEGDISSLVNNQNGNSQIDDNVTNNTTVTNNTRNSNTSSANSSNDRRGNNMDNSVINKLLKDLIKIIIIKELLSKQNNSFNACSNYNYMQGELPRSYYNPMGFGM